MSVLPQWAYAEIRLGEICVFHNGPHVRLGNRNVINSWETGNTTSLTLTSHQLDPGLMPGRRVKTFSILASEYSKEYVKEVVKLNEKIHKTPNMLDFCQDVVRFPNSTLLFFDYGTLQDPVDALDPGSLLPLTKL